MKRLEELGISPTPWKVVPYGVSTDSNKPTVGDVVDATGESLLLDMPIYKDARLIAAAPKLYDAGCGVVVEKCKKCVWCNYKPTNKCEFAGKCTVKNLRAALAEAAGGSEVGQ